MGQEYPTQDQYPTLAASENFEVWQDRDEGSVIIAFNVNGVTVAVDQPDFDEFAQVVSEAARKMRAGGQGMMS